MEDKEKLYQSHLGTIQRTPGGYKYPGDFKAAGFPADEWPRLVKDSGLDEVEFYGEPGFPEQP